jgi:hypothetical protein
VEELTQAASAEESPVWRLLEQSFVSTGPGLSCRHERGACCRGARTLPGGPERRVIVVTDLNSLRGLSRGTVELRLGTTEIHIFLG